MEDFKLTPKNVGIFTLVILALIILIQNSGAVTLRLLFWKVSMSSIILVPLIFLLGGVTGFLIALFTRKNPPGNPTV